MIKNRLELKSKLKKWRIEGMDRNKLLESMHELILQAESETNRLSLDIEVLKHDIYALIDGKDDWGE